MKLRYLSVCSGIEVASLAWRHLGWVPVAFAEIEPFSCAVLAHHYPSVPNLGDMTGIDGTQFTGLVDVLVAGTPCQSFSVAGLREGLSDSRGNLTLKFVELANAIKPSVAVVWENVPGVLSMRDNAFGCFLAGLAGSDGPLLPARSGRWPDAGLVFGPLRAIAWRVLDAQYFGLAQRRRRVFVVASPRNGLNPSEILFEFDGVRRDTPPRREARADTAGTVKSSLGRRRGAGTSPGAITSHWEGGVHPCLNQSTHSSGGIGMSDQELFNQRGAGLVPHGYIADVSPTLRAGGNSTGGDRPMGMDVDTCESLVSYAPEIVSQAISCKWSKGTSGPAGDEHHNLVCTPVATAVTARSPSRGADSDFTSTHIVHLSFAQNSRDEVRLQGGDGQIAGCLQSDEGVKRRTYVASVPAMAFTERGRNQGRTCECQEEQAFCQQNPGGGRSHSLQIVTPQMQVRRLTPMECERLQGIPDNYTLVPYKHLAGLPANIILRSYRRYLARMERQAKTPLPLGDLLKCADGPRYKAIGNGMARNVIQWIGERIEMALTAKGGPYA